MVAATVDPQITDGALADALVMYAVVDGFGLSPVEPLWVERYDMYGAAIEVLSWKKSAAVGMVNFNADGTQAALSDISTHLNERIQYYSALRMTGTITVSQT
jgi:hypothetical protein